jgi:hypothetical protein
MLRYSSQLVEVAKRPFHEQLAAIAALPPIPSDEEHQLSCALLPPGMRVFKSSLRRVAILRSAAVALACERFRRVNGRWPTNLAEIPRDTLPAVPLDPFDGSPIRFKVLDDGAVVYSTGPDRVNDGGVLLSEREEPGTDIGFRLWNPDHRGLPSVIPDDSDPAIAPLPRPPLREIAKKVLRQVPSALLQLAKLAPYDGGMLEPARFFPHRLFTSGFHIRV